MLNLKHPKIREIVPKVFVVIFDNQFDLAMTFCRFQEFYESPKFRGKSFTWNEFIRWYSKKHGEGSFSYPKDWNGFNIPSNELYKAFKNLRRQDDEYTRMMHDITAEIERRTGENYTYSSFYLIGVHTEKDNKETYASLVRHEVAHGLYYTNKSYRKEMLCLIDKLPKKIYNHITRALKRVGYGSNVFEDEAQAYMATGLRVGMNETLLAPYRNKFIKLLGKYFNGKILK